MIFKGKKILIFGLGKLGGGLANALFAIKEGGEVTITDLADEKALAEPLKKLKPYLKEIKLILGRHRKSDFLKNDIIIVNPAIPADNKFLQIARKFKKEIVNDCSLFFKFKKGKTIAITGTRGKTTTSFWIFHILKSKYPKVILGGNQPDKALLKILKKTTRNSISVVELSSFQLEFYSPDLPPPEVAVITNLYRDHLNRHKTMKKYADIKARIFANQTSNNYLILNYDNPWTKYFLAKKPKSKIYFVSLRPLPLKLNGAFIHENSLYFQENGRNKKIFSIKNILKNKGKHNYYNYLQASLVSFLFGLKWKEIRQASFSLPEVKFRQEIIYCSKNLTIINDSCATIPEATIALLEKFKKEKEKILLITGGTDKNLIFDQLAKKIKELLHPNQLLLLEGSATEKLIKELKKLKYSDFLLFSSLKKIVVFIQTIIKKNNQKIILFSPASASFEKFKNEFDRGEKFNQLIKKIIITNL